MTLYITGGEKTINNQEGKFPWPIITEESKKVVLEQLTESVSIYNKSGIFKEFEDNFSSYHEMKYCGETPAR